MVGMSICSYSFHRLLGAGKQDVFQYIRDCWVLGCVELDPWNGHMAMMKAGDELADKGGGGVLSEEEVAHVGKMRAAGDAVGLPFGTVAVDGAYIFDVDGEKMKANRRRAYRWLEVCGRLGAKRMRVDSGGAEEMTEEMLGVICEGYTDLIARGKDKGVEVLMENHWGSSIIPQNLLRILEGTPGLGLLLDTGNWKDGQKGEGRRWCAPYARAVHIKSFAWEGDKEVEQRLPEAIEILRVAGFKGVWGVESVPRDGDEMGGVRKTMRLIERCVGGGGEA